MYRQSEKLISRSEIEVAAKVVSNSELGIVRTPFIPAHLSRSNNNNGDSTDLAKYESIEAQFPFRKFRNAISRPIHFSQLALFRRSRVWVSGLLRRRWLRSVPQIGEHANDGLVQTSRNREPDEACHEVPGRLSFQRIGHDVRRYQFRLSFDQLSLPAFLA